MSAFIFIIVPIALLALVSGFCFVGCVLHTHGTGEDKPPEDKTFTKYSDTDVLPTCVAYWPLSEPSATAGNPIASAIAKDAKGNNNGNYTHKGNAPAGMFPCPGFQIAAGVDSAPAIGSLALGMVSLLPGDAVQPANDPDILMTGMQVDGGFVTVPVNGTINPSPTFSIECWAQPEWSEDDLPAYHAVVDSRTVDNTSTVFSGYAIVVNEDGQWEAQLGAVGIPAFVIVTGEKAKLGEPNHVVLTFDGTNAALFVDGGPPVTKPLGGTFAPNTLSPLVIGVGAPWAPTRMPGSPNSTFPLFPFKGSIQDVAVYDSVLAPSDISTHFNDGSGKTKVAED